MALSAAVALLFFAVSVRGDCSFARQRFSKRSVTLSGVNDTDGERVCAGGGRCCSARDLPDLDDLARRQMSTFLNQALTFSHTTMQKSAENLDGAICSKLSETSEKSHNLLQRTYGAYYTRNRELFTNFYCNLSVIYLRCDKCLETTEQVTKDFLRRLLLVLLKEQRQVTLVSERYERCVFANINLESTFGAPMITWLISRLQKGLCSSCIFRKGLTAATSLVVAVKKHRIDGKCEQNLRCMQSCSCCSGGRQCQYRPCYNCCIEALTPCISPDYTSLHPQFSRTVGRLRHEANNMLGNTVDPDFMIQSLSVTMSEAIMNAYNKLTSVMKKMTNACGNIRAHVVNSRIPAPAVVCPICSGSLKTVKTALLNARDYLLSIQNTFAQLKDRICSENAEDPTAAQSCDSCLHCYNLTSFQDRPSVYQHELDVMERDLPAVFKTPIVDPTKGPMTRETVMIDTITDFTTSQQTPVVTTTKMCSSEEDDEDCAGSGGSGGSGGAASGGGSGTSEPLSSKSDVPPKQNAPPEPPSRTGSSGVNEDTEQELTPVSSTPGPSVYSVWNLLETPTLGLPRDADPVDRRSGSPALLHSTAVLLACVCTFLLVH